MEDFRNLEPVQPNTPPADASLAEEATERHYRLKCFVICKRFSFEDEQSNGVSNNTTVSAFLIPDQSTQMQLFFDAWLPLQGEEKLYNEVAVMIGHPVQSKIRVAVHKPTQIMQKPHMVAMTERGEHILIKFFNGRVRAARANPLALRIDVVVLKGSEENSLG
jgi:hypothetical protein